MLITLCYLYLWARWGRRPAALVRITVQRLRASRCSFTFCGAAARPRDASVCLSRGGRVFCVSESQVGGHPLGRVPAARAGAGQRRRGARPPGGSLAPAGSARLDARLSPGPWEPGKRPPRRPEAPGWGPGSARPGARMRGSEVRKLTGDLAHGCLCDRALATGAEPT